MFDPIAAFEAARDAGYYTGKIQNGCHGNPPVDAREEALCTLQGAQG